MVVLPLLATSDDDVDEFAIDTETSLVEKPLRNLKHGDAFAVLDSYGDCGAVGGSPEGLYFRDMRHLSRFGITLRGHKLLLLSSVMQDDNAALAVELTNPDLEFEGANVVRDSIAIERLKFLWDDACYERIGFRSFGDRASSLPITIEFKSDFKDLFEVRGTERKHRGRVTARVLDKSRVELVYSCLDGERRSTVIEFSIIF